MIRKSIRKNISTVRKSFTFAIGCAIVLIGMILTGCNSSKGNELTDSKAIIDYILEKEPDAVISVGILDAGKEDKCIYTTEGKKDYKEYQYQIGSITKTFTGAMIANQEQLGHLKLSDGNPPLEQLVTHKSGLNDLWERAFSENPDITYTREELLETAKNHAQKGNHDFYYSNFGSAVAGTIAADAYAKNHGITDSSYENCMNDFIRNELKLEDTKVGGCGDFRHNFNWKSGDEMMADGAMTSNVTDLLKYGQLYLSASEEYAYLKNAIKPLSEVDDDFEIGYFWLIDKKMGIIWHNGEVNFEDDKGKEVGSQSFIGISPEDNKVVVILSNVILNDEDDTAYTDLLGYMLMSEQ